MLPPLIMPIFLVMFTVNTHLFLLAGFCISCAGLALMFLYMPESPKYLYSVHKIKECERVLNLIAYRNGLSKKESEKIIDLRK
jgi:hypothetical protein